VGAEAPARVWLSVSWKTVALLLKPVVLTLAMLLPVTSIICWWVRRPETPAYMERSMGVSSLRGWSGEGRSAAACRG
jgi:hypothetical protein